MSVFLLGVLCLGPSTLLSFLSVLCLFSKSRLLFSIAPEVKKELDSVNQTLVMQLREKGATSSCFLFLCAFCVCALCLCLYLYLYLWVSVCPSLSSLSPSGLTVCNSSVDTDGLSCVSVGIETTEMTAQRAVEYAQVENQVVMTSLCD